MYEQRKYAYINEADSLMFKHQRGEIEKQVWLNKIQEIKERYPYASNTTSDIALLIRDGLIEPDLD